MPSSMKKEKKQRPERWLLTRKTWKYMIDAGRKLIPPPPPNQLTQVDDDIIRKCEENFQKICSVEPKFILWSRKCSYPGALAAPRTGATNRYYLRRFLSKSQKSLIELNEFHSNTDEIIKLLQNYLNLNDTNKKMTTLLSAKTIRPDQTVSPSAKRQQQTSILNSTSTPSSSSTAYKPTAKHRSNSQYQSNSDNLKAQLNDLLIRLQKYNCKYNGSCNNILLNINDITPEILDNKILLKKIYNELKKQQLHRLLDNNGGSGGTSGTSGNRSSNNNNNNNNNNNSNNNRNRNVSGGGGDADNQNIRNTSSSSGSGSNNNNNNNNNSSPNSTIRSPAVNESVKTYTTFGTQTEFINLNELKSLAKEYEANKYYNNGDDDERSRQHRKCSIDNDDISQSVSDTIKRYLRMARKKSSVNDEPQQQQQTTMPLDSKHRFKRVNYDRNLRYIRSKGEISPPGMDENGTIKQTQTLDAWPLLELKFLLGNDITKLLHESHDEWDKQLQDRLKYKQDYDNKQQQQQQQHSNLNIPLSSGSSGLLTSGQQFLSNLWHGGSHLSSQTGSGGSGSCNSNQPSPANSLASISSTTSMGYQPQLDFNNSKKHKNSNKEAGRGEPEVDDLTDNNNTKMHKSKSSSNVGQFVTSKIWKSRSKSQTRPSLSATSLGQQKPLPNLSKDYQPKSNWKPQGNCTWLSNSSGKRMILSDRKLNDLSEIERKFLYRIAIEKINQLNMGVTVTSPNNENNGENVTTTKPVQKRRPLLIKRKALTTSFFDTTKNKDDKTTTNGLVFGISLEKCIENDRKSYEQQQQQRNLRNSITSLLGGIPVRREGASSCEFLPSNLIIAATTPATSDNVAILTSKKISQSQNDISKRNMEQQQIPTAIIRRTQHIPLIVQLCIKHLENFGLNTIGIFRVSTSKKRVRQLKEDFDNGTIKTLNSDICPHDVATLLKDYLRELPEPLLSYNLYEAFVKTQKIRNRRLQLEALSHLVQLLPLSHRDTLYFLLRFLAKIVRSSDDVVRRDGSVVSVGNKMDSSNLATIFAPNILRYDSSSNNLTATIMKSTTQINSMKTEQEIDEQIDVINVIRTMIDHYEELFRISAELIDEIYTNMLSECPQHLDYICDGDDTIGNRIDNEIIGRRRDQIKYFDENKKQYSFHHRLTEGNTNNDAGNNGLQQQYYQTAQNSSLMLNNRNNHEIYGNISLKIPTQCQGRMDLSDIPYIEDSANSSSGQEYCAEIGKTGSFFPSGRSSDGGTKLLKHILEKKSDPELKLQIYDTASFQQQSNQHEQRKNSYPNLDYQQQPYEPHEPKSTPSITNIGNKVLRCKTVDFEKFMMKNKSVAAVPLQQNDNEVKQNPPESRIGPIYKRRELISSAKRK